MFQVIGACVPRDHARQVRSEYYIERVMSGSTDAPVVLDLGCGTGESFDKFRKRNPNVCWRGLDIEGSPEVNARVRTDASFYSFDGVNIPFEEDQFDLVYSHQVFEHVRHPEALLREVCRVLKPGGAFTGSVSSLEPYHSFSYWSFTPFGWYTLLADAGLVPTEFRPGIDGRALLERQYRQRPPESKNWFELSPLNQEIDEWAARENVPVAKVNRLKLKYCGHLVFLATKPRDP